MKIHRLHFSTWLLLGLNLALLSAQTGFSKQAALHQRGTDIHLFWTNPFYFMMLGCLGLQAVLWPFLLKRCPLGFAYSTTSLNLISMLLIGRVIFGESVTWSNLIGCLLIVIGVWLWSSSAKVGVAS
jgi:drug/metabolite transporter (DMT)-like permease